MCGDAPVALCSSDSLKTDMLPGIGSALLRTSHGDILMQMVIARMDKATHTNLTLTSGRENGRDAGFTQMGVGQGCIFHGTALVRAPRILPLAACAEPCGLLRLNIATGGERGSICRKIMIAATKSEET